jgi:hypothetical protein
MHKKNIKFGRDDWNLDFLQLRGKLFNPGSINKVRIPVDGHAIGAMQFTPDGKLLLLERASGRLHQIDFDTEQGKANAWEVPWNRPPEVVCDLSTSRRALYFLVPKRREVWVCHWSDAALTRTGNQIRFEKLMEMPDDTVTEETRITILSDLLEDTVCLAPTASGKALVFKSKAPRIQDMHLLDISKREDRKKVHVSAMCSDWRANSIVIADSNNHKLLELKLGSGRLDVLCGTSKPGYDSEPVPAAHAAIRAPSAVAVARPYDMIPEDLLSRPSNIILSEDHSRILPRTILFSQPQDKAVRRLVQLPDTVRLQSFKGKSTIYPLLGDHLLSDDHEPAEGLFGVSYDCLFLSLSLAGELALLTADAVLRFCPATAVNTVTLEQGALASRAIPT